MPAAALRLVTEEAEPFNEYLPIYRVQIERTGSLPCGLRTCTAVSDVVELVREMIGTADREHFLALYVNAQLRFIGAHVVAIGGRANVDVSAAEIFKPGLLCNATGVVLAHNHPSGHRRPSNADRIVTGHFEIAGALLGIQVVDHVILGEGDGFSMRGEDLMLIPLECEFDAEGFVQSMAEDKLAAKAPGQRPPGTAAAG